MPKGIEIRDLIVGTGDEATKESIVSVNVREFLRRGDKVSRSPLFGAKRLIDLGRRESIAGLRYGIPGMRVGGTREIVISPHLAYGEAGIPGRIPANALLRCEVELLEIRQHSALLSQDWLPGKTLMLHRSRDASDPQRGWAFTMHEGGNSELAFQQEIQEKQQGRTRLSQIPISLEAEESAGLIREAIDLPNQMPEDCVDWDSGFISMQSGEIVTDSRNEARCMVIRVMDGGRNVSLFGIHEDSPAFLDCSFYHAIRRLIGPHIFSEPTST